MLRSATALASLLAAAAFAAPAAGQDVLPTPESGQIEVGTPAAAAGAAIRDGDRQIGTLEVNREGESIVAIAIFERRPAGRRSQLCLTIGGEKRCVRRASRRGLRLERRFTAPFDADLVARVRAGDARAFVEL
jgi:hypothetical protein